jgi:chemotaxis protein MotB
MITGGMDEFKVLRVVGLSSTVLFDKNDPLSSTNRRISIVVLNKRTEDAMLQEDGNAETALPAAGVTESGESVAAVPAAKPEIKN